MDIFWITSQSQNDDETSANRSIKVTNRATLGNYPSNDYLPSQFSNPNIDKFQVGNALQAKMKESNISYLFHFLLNPM
uniref:Uncharacterized protein n=1 Tax=Romanomermis culicivorax TaxID=13658 RepID=A0A915L5H2_ROMCU